MEQTTRKQNVMIESTFCHKLTLAAPTLSFRRLSRMPKATTIKTTAAKASSSNVTKGKTTLVQSTLAGFSKTTVKATVAVADENAYVARSRVGNTSHLLL